MHPWDKDREEIDQHWNNLSWFQQFILLFILNLMSSKTVKSFNYILHRLYVRSDKYVRASDSHWTTINEYLEKQ